MINFSRRRQLPLLIAALAIASTALLPRLSMAQAASADASPFRTGQTAVEFGVDGSFASVGLLRFTAPRRALLFDIQANVARVRNEYTDRGVAGPLPDDDAETVYRLGARLGLRSYRAVTARVERFSTFGLRTELSKTRQSFQLQSINSTNTAAGAFAELGGAWMVTPNLSLGAVWNASLLYSRYDREYGTISSSESKESTLAFSFGNVAIRANLYF